MFRHVLMLFFPLLLLAQGNETINVLPVSPTDASTITIQTSGNASQGIANVSSFYAQSGTTINLYVDVTLGVLTVIDTWQSTESIGTLPVGSYTVNLHLSICRRNFLGGSVCTEYGPFAASFIVVPHATPVSIDIIPGTFPNTLNCINQNQSIPVAILSTETFDATTIDHRTVRFGPNTASEVHQSKGTAKRHEEDVNNDGKPDLVLHFNLGESGLPCSATEASITGMTWNGDAITGTDAVHMINAPSSAIHSASHEITPSIFQLSQNFPNPFNPSTSITYGLPAASRVKLEIFDMLGQRVSSLVDAQNEPGYYNVNWDASAIASGLYFYRMDATNLADPSQSFSQVRKLMLVR